ncbi:MAG: TetR/AcrR family transcriptional regulator [Jiangellaceae bacterium]
MALSDRRERLRAATEADIRAGTRRLLTEQGPHAVTLRAIAGQLGMTAPAIYRYFDSREALLRGVCDDVCADLTDELRSAVELTDDRDDRARVLGLCRAFRAWALGHPQEFGLVFATPGDADQFAVVFLTMVVELFRGDDAPDRLEQAPPPELTAHVEASRRSMIAALAATGVDLPEHPISLGAVHWILQWWVRLYGHVALEVFGRFPFEVSGAERMFESMLADLAEQTALTGARP